MVDAYPLQWPAGWKRTTNRARSRFGEKDHSNYGLKLVTHSKALSYTLAEIERLEVKSKVVSTNLQLRNYGLPYASQRLLQDPGVAVYFTKDGKERCIPCDKWDRVEDNLYAIGKTIEALRGIERWGAKDMVTAAFKGFEALPYYSDGDKIKQTDYFEGCRDRYEVRQKYLLLVKSLHPDVGGDKNEFTIMQTQYQKRMEIV
jgi:hypothetical protein